MSTGIYVENCKNVTIEGNRFQNIDNPVVIKRTKGIYADNNVATYDSGYFRLTRLTIAMRRIING
ncbi:hypothetical protein ACI2JM_11490 [Psychrobacter sp. NPDC064578]|uniref:hypothetical protein n=1 Tax=Psychrobacter sp. NPDC064578 TaxID=3364493 RepID=UPI00384F096D